MSLTNSGYGKVEAGSITSGKRGSKAPAMDLDSVDKCLASVGDLLARTDALQPELGDNRMNFLLLFLTHPAVGLGDGIERINQ